MWTALGNAAVILICAYGGLVIFAFYQGYLCDPLKADVRRYISQTRLFK